jgi:hypothetical protein
MTENEFARFIKQGLGTPLVSPALSLRIADDVRKRQTTRGDSRAHDGGRRRHLPLLAIAVAVAIVLVGAGAVFAGYLLQTVPVHVISGHPEAGSYAHKVAPNTEPYKTSLAHAQAVAGFHILTLPAAEGQLQSVTVYPGTGGSSQAYSVVIMSQARGTVIQIVEDPEPPESSFNFNVKPYGASQTHTATIDGINIVYAGDSQSTYFIGLQMSDGLVIFMRSDASNGNPLSVQQWVELVKELS